LTLSPGDLEFVISDDGRGFDAGLDADRPARSDSFGLRATRERVDQLGGTLDVRSLPGTGTTLRVSLALEGRA
ncbi:ATP-binding protein, partial [Burkholderia sp. SIMBA_024]